MRLDAQALREPVRASFPAQAAAVQEADIITGARNRAALPQLVRAFSLDRQRIVSIPQHQKGEAFESCSAADFGVRTRAFLKIQDGCDNWCSYCIIPAARGPVRSKPLPELQTELLTLSQNGYREIVLTGINLSNYGREWGCTSRMPFWRQPPPPASSGSVSVPSNPTSSLRRKFTAWRRAVGASSARSSTFRCKAAAMPPCAA